MLSQLPGGGKAERRETWVVISEQQPLPFAIAAHKPTRKKTPLWWERRAQAQAEAGRSSRAKRTP